MLYLICILSIIFLIAFGTIYNIYKNKKCDYNDQFKKEKNAAIEQFNHAYVKKLSHEEVKLKLELSQLIGELAEKKRNYEMDISTLEGEIIVAKTKRDSEIAKLDAELLQAVEEKSKTEAAQLQSVISYYDSQKTEITESFNNFKDTIDTKKAALQEELRKAENRQQEIIEQYKRAEQIKQNKDFYRIVLSENAQEDVKKLRKIADELHDPSVLYKLIYKTYYERPFNEMIGRVITGRGSIGIYKITNIENGRVYIGQTKQSFKERWRTHLKRGVKAEPGTANKLYSAMWDDGIENFTFEVLAECDSSELNIKEKEYISLYHGDTWGYNTQSGNNG